MGFRTTTILFAILLILGGYVYFGEYRGKEDREKRKADEKKVFSFAAKEISELTISYDDATFAGKRKGEKDWEIVSPAGYEADSDAWDSLASSVTFIERDSVVTAKDATIDPKTFGLDKPVKVSMKLADGKSPEVLFGSENPRQTLSYVQVAGTNEVFLSPNKASTFRKTLTDLRNKKVLNFESDSVSAFRIVDGAKEMAFEKSGPEWLLKKPVQAKADSSEIINFLGAVQFARAVDFAAPAVDLKQAGLVPPALQLVIHDAKAGADRTLWIGKVQGEGKRYAKDASRDPIFVLDKEIPDKLARPLADWRDKSLGTVDRDQADEIVITKGADKLVLKKAGADWIFPDGSKVQATKVSGMFDTIEFQRATEFVDPKPGATFGLDKPRLDVTFRTGGTENLRLQFGSDQSAESVYVKTSSGSNAVVSKSLYNVFDVSAGELAEPKPEAKPAGK